MLPLSHSFALTFFPPSTCLLPPSPPFLSMLRVIKSGTQEKYSYNKWPRNVCSNCYSIMAKSGQIQNVKCMI